MKKLIIIIFFATSIFSCGKKKDTAANSIIDETIAVNTENVLSANTFMPIEVAGLVASIEEARLSFKTGGIIEKIYVKEGQNVTKGQLLATLNLTEINANVQQANEATTWQSLVFTQFHWSAKPAQICPHQRLRII